MPKQINHLNTSKWSASDLPDLDNYWQHLLAQHHRQIDNRPLSSKTAPCHKHEKTYVAKEHQVSNSVVTWALAAV